MGNSFLGSCILFRLLVKWGGVAGWYTSYFVNVTKRACWPSHTLPGQLLTHWLLRWNQGLIQHCFLENDAWRYDVTHGIQCTSLSVAETPMVVRSFKLRAPLAVHRCSESSYHTTGSSATVLLHLTKNKYVAVKKVVTSCCPLRLFSRRSSNHRYVIPLFAFVNQVFVSHFIYFFK